MQCAKRFNKPFRATTRWHRSRTCVGLTLILDVPLPLPQLICPFYLSLISPSRIGQISQPPESKSTQPRSETRCVMSPCIIVSCGSIGSTRAVCRRRRRRRWSRRSWAKPRWLRASRSLLGTHRSWSWQRTRGRLSLRTAAGYIWKWSGVKLWFHYDVHKFEWFKRTWHRNNHILHVAVITIIRVKSCYIYWYLFNVLLVVQISLKRCRMNMLSDSFIAWWYRCTMHSY